MMGHQGMHYSLVSREVIADSIETWWRPEPRRLVAARRLRQEHARLLMAMARLNVAQHLRLRRQHPARPASTATTSTSSSPSRPSAGASAGKITQGRRPASSARPARGRLLRRHVHRQHHGRHRGPGPVAAATSQPRRRRPPSEGFARRSGKAVVECSTRASPPAKSSPSRPSKRLHRRARPGRLHERRAPPDGHRPRGRRRVDAGRLRPARRKVPTSPTSSRAAAS